jgi:hypothetical protein
MMTPCFTRQGACFPLNARRSTLHHMQQMQCHPIALCGSDGKEMNILATKDVHKSIPNDPKAFSVWKVPGTARQWNTTRQCERCSPLPVPGLEDLLNSSPFAKILRTREFVEISDQVCRNMNLDWTRRPQCRCACGQYFAGAILFRIDSSEAVMINTMEVYGRTNLKDAHRETFGIQKLPAIDTSLPAADGGDRYSDIRQVTMTSSTRKPAGRAIHQQRKAPATNDKSTATVVSKKRAPSQREPIVTRSKKPRHSPSKSEGFRRTAWRRDLFGSGTYDILVRSCPRREDTIRECFSHCGRDPGIGESISCVTRYAVRYQVRNRSVACTIPMCA